MIFKVLLQDDESAVLYPDWFLWSAFELPWNLEWRLKFFFFCKFQVLYLVDQSNLSWNLRMKKHFLNQVLSFIFNWSRCTKLILPWILERRITKYFFWKFQVLNLLDQDLQSFFFKKLLLKCSKESFKKYVFKWGEGGGGGIAKWHRMSQWGEGGYWSLTRVKY